MSIQVRQLSKRFGQFSALDKVDLEVPSGKLTAILGPSGSGKTTLLRIIAGLEHADSGRVEYHGEDVTERAAKDRNVGFVFQHYALFRHMTVFENVAFGMRVRKVPNAEVQQRVRELLSLVRLESLEHRFPSQLSGGQRQRVALARALAIRPHVLLLDEPFGALDAKVRQELRQWLRRLHDEIKMTSVFVTHDQEEAFEVADTVVVMNRGRIEQTGTPQEVFEEPANSFVLDFLGNVNIFHGRIENGQAILGQFQVDCPEFATRPAGTAALYMRPHEMEIARGRNGHASMPAQIQRIHSAGPVARVTLRAENHHGDIQVDLAPDRAADLALSVGDQVYVSPRKVRVFVPEDYSI